MRTRAKVVQQGKEMTLSSHRGGEAVLRAVTKGLSNADITRQEGLAEITVKNHLTRAFKKLKAITRAEAAAIALRKHLLKT